MRSVRRDFIRVGSAERRRERLRGAFRLLMAFGLSLLAFGLSGIASVPAFADAECRPFARLPETFAAELSLDLKASEIRFLPFELASSASEKVRLKGFVLQDVASCGLRGQCDSIAYVAFGAVAEKPCYREVLSFTGHFAGVETSAKRRGPGSIRVDHRKFTWNEKEFRFAEELR